MKFDWLLGSSKPCTLHHDATDMDRSPFVLNPSACSLWSVRLDVNLILYLAFLASAGHSAS